MIVVYGYEAASHFLGVAVYFGSQWLWFGRSFREACFFYWDCNNSVQLIFSFPFPLREHHISNILVNGHIAFSILELRCILEAKVCVVDVDFQGSVVIPFLYQYFLSCFFLRCVKGR